MKSFQTECLDDNILIAENINVLIALLTVKKNIRPVGRIECYSKKELDSFLEKIKDFSLHCKIIDKSDDVKNKEVKMHIYFSKNKQNKEKIDKLVELDEKGSYNDETFAKMNKEMGKIYNYPDCCIDWFVDFLLNWFSENKKSKIKLIEPNYGSISLKVLSNSKGNSFNKAVNCCQNDSPLLHIPHSFKCRKSISIGKESLKILKEHNKELFLRYQKYLSGAFKIYENKIVKIKNYCQSNRKDNIIYFK